MRALRIVEDQMNNTQKTEHPPRRKASRLYKYEEPPKSLGLHWVKLFWILISKGSLSLLKILGTKSLVEMFNSGKVIPSLMMLVQDTLYRKSPSLAFGEGNDNDVNEGRSTDKIKGLNAEAEGVNAAGETLSTATLAISAASVQPVLLCSFKNHKAKMENHATKETLAKDKTVSLVGHVGYVNTVADSPDESLYASGRNNGNILLWDLAEGKRLYPLESGLIIHGLCFSMRYWICTTTEANIKYGGFKIESEMAVNEAATQANAGKTIYMESEMAVDLR
nr:hypothetical protein [Tanacetum cinerariifolium]